MRILTWNVNGIRACAKKGFLDWLHQDRPDVLCLQETRANEGQIPEGVRRPEGYHAHWFSAKRPGYSGVAILSKEPPDDIIHGLGDDRFDQEGRTQQWVKDDLVLINNYVPNGGRDLSRVEFKLEFYDLLLKVALAWEKQGKAVVITGDWNTCHQSIDLARPKDNQKNTGFLPEERKWIDTFVELGFSDVFREQHPDMEGAYSWWSQRGGAREKNVGWRLDYFLISEAHKNRALDNRILPQVLGSDHCPVQLDWQHEH